MIAQHDLLEQVAELAEAGSIRSTLRAELEPFGAATLRRAHEMVEGGHMVGKVVVTGF
jgi:NADPH2:quinone reductase